MITLIEVQASNSRITSTLSSPLVAIFVGGTNGVGETTLKQFVKYAPPSSRVYNIGRSQESADRIGNECQDLNGRVKYEFIKADTSLLGNIDQVCRKVKSKERSINLLFLTMGTLDFQTGILFSLLKLLFVLIPPVLSLFMFFPPHSTVI